MGGDLSPETLRRLRGRTYLLLTSALALGLGACSQPVTTASAPAATEKAAEEAEEVEFPEFAATPAELAEHGVDDIVKSLRLNATAMRLGSTVYDANCSVCHGPELGGSREQHAPDLTDAEWMFSGDNLESGGLNKLPSDVEWTVLYGIRNDHARSRGLEADMVAYLPEYRNERDTAAYGNQRFLTDEEIDDVAEYVMQVSGQQVSDRAKADRGRVLFMDRANCFDCHGDEATGNPALGSANLTRPDLYLFGSDRSTVIETIEQGRRGSMPAFEGRLSPQEIKAVSVYVFARALKGPRVVTGR
jgi:cbb3-type cytochrome c oxidase subunit III